MKNYITFSLLVLFAYSCKKDVVNAKVDNSPVKIEQVAKLTSEIKKVKVEQAGLCDTCVASYESVILENRTLAYQLQIENQKMAIQLQKMQSILDSNNRLVIRAEKIFARNKSKSQNLERLDYEVVADNH